MAVKSSIIQINSAKRHVVKINNINAMKHVYVEKALLNSRELISTPVNSIAVFCNEFTPENSTKNLIKYVLTVNGKDYNIVPINSSRNGIKIIRTSDYNHPSEYASYINEKIKSAKLTIVMNSFNDTEAPVISNIKILTGGI